MTLNRVIFLILLLALLPAALMAQIAPVNSGADYSQFDWKTAGQIAVQAGGRVKPLDTYARDLVSMVYGKSSYEGQNPVMTYFLWMADGEKWAKTPLLYLPKGELRTKIGLESKAGSHFAFLEMHEHPALMDIATDGQKAQEAGGKANFVQTKAIDLLNRMQVMSAVFSHEGPYFVPVSGDDPNAEWLPMTRALAALSDSTADSTKTSTVSDTLQTMGLAFVGMYNAVREGRADIFNTASSLFLSTQTLLIKNQPGVVARISREIFYNRFQPFFWAKVLLGLSFVCFLFGINPKWAVLQKFGLPLLAAGFLVYTSGMGLRAYIAARAPWSNMYESLLAIGWAAVLLTTLYEWIKRDRIFGMIGGVLGAVILSIAQFATLDRGINPLVPALQSYWLNYHVIITLSGYASFAIALGLGHAVLIAGVKSKGQVTPTLAALTKANLRIIQIGSLLLITGILLGAVWANVSWGRFWGWDPKETWALICWFMYIAFLHGRSAGWLAWRGLAAYSVGAFPVVIMTYYGVNYYLSGLHSYGAGSAPGVPWQIFAYVGLEAVFLFWALRQLRGTVPTRPKKTKQDFAGAQQAKTTEATS
jgi:cytochrome c-type biogenesis protein CcsB